jgi:hypothetical protein
MAPRTEEILEERDSQEVIELSPNVAMALIAGAQEESREELMELWARLLANAMDPRMNSVRQSFIDAVKRMDPFDAVVLRYVHQENISAISVGTKEPNNREFGIGNVSDAIGRRYDEVEVSLRHLLDLSFFDEPRGVGRGWFVNATCREFLRACYPEVKTD